MKTDVIKVSSNGMQIDSALMLAEKVAAYKNLSKKNALHLRLLVEETLSMMRSITGDVDGKLWIEDNDGVFQLHLHARTETDDKQREQIVSASTSGKNEATRGIMGKIRAFFEPVDGLPVFMDLSPDGLYTNMTWSLRTYQTQIHQYVEQNREGAAEAWDELEKSVISHIADEVKVSIHGRDVEMVIFKKMA